jgi:DMSO/TMAO reductase YedYZ molybdopterin-dependent catalytic subunit
MDDNSKQPDQDFTLAKQSEDATLIEQPNERRRFLRGASLASFATLLGVSAIPFHKNMAEGLVPIALVDDTEGNAALGKDGLTIHNDRPVNAEPAAHLLDDRITPQTRHFIRNNGTPPTSMDVDTWTLTIDGLVDNPMTLSIADLKKKFEVVTKQLVIECGGNGRAFFSPPAKGNQWGYGAVACSEWTGVRLVDVLKEAGIKDNVVYTAHVGADTHLSGKAGKLAISRGVPIKKAMDPNILIAFEQNGKPIHPMNGAPLRLVVPGWPGSCSQKWLTRIYLRDIVHDGPKMTGTAYRIPNRPVAPGEKVDKKDFVIIEAMPVKSLITFPATGQTFNDKKLSIRGHAWAGDQKVKEVHVSHDFGATWQKAKLEKPANDGAWQHWSADLSFPLSGYYEVWARATDSEGITQPFAITWNPKGYLNNSFHRISLVVA